MGTAQSAAPPAGLVAGDGLPPEKRRSAMLVIILGITMAVLDGSIVNLALPGEHLEKPEFSVTAPKRC